MNKNYLGLLAAFFLICILIASCTQLQGSSLERVDFKCSDALGCAEIPPGEPIHIAYALVISGPDETIGIDSRNGIEIAIADKGQILGHDILLTGEDEQCKPEGGLTASTKLAADFTTIAVVGTSCSNAARTGIPVLSQAGLTIVSPSNTDLELTIEGNENNHPGYARTAPNNRFQGLAAAKFAINVLGVRKAATIIDSSLSAGQLQEVFAVAFQEMGGILTAQEIVDPDLIDIQSMLMNIADGEPELIYYPVHIKAGSLITRQAQETTGLENTYLMGADRMFSPVFVENTKDFVKGFFVSSPDFTEFDEVYISDFLPKYLEKFDSAPVNIYHAHAYDAFMLIANAIEKVAELDQDGTLHIPRQALRDAVYITKNHQGLTGNLTCTPTGDCADAHIAIYQYHLSEFPPERIWP